MSSPPGESPPPPPRAVFGRSDPIERIVGLAEDRTPVGLIGAGGIGKTSIVLTVLHDSRVKQRFGENRRFIRCDQFPPSLTHFLSRLSNVIGAGINSPEDLASLRPSLSSKEMLLVLDNAESILDPQGTEGVEIYGVVEELSRFSDVWLIITSRFSIIPPDARPSISRCCRWRPRVRRSTGSTRVGHGATMWTRCWRNWTFIRCRSHCWPLLRTIASGMSSVWRGSGRSVGRGYCRRAYNRSLAAAIEVSLASPMFKELGPDGRELLGVIAFLPRGINESNLEWLFPTLPDITPSSTTSACSL